MRLVSRSALVALAIGCASKQPPVPEAGSVEGSATIGKNWPGTDAELQLYRALAVRDPEPVCAEVEALVPEPVASLAMIAEDIPMPPWAGMRAASCLARGHAEAAEGKLRDWVVAEEGTGLAILVLQHLDQMPEPVAVELVRDALEGPWAQEASDAAAGSDRPAVRALLP